MANETRRGFGRIAGVAAMSSMAAGAQKAENGKTDQPPGAQRTMIYTDHRLSRFDPLERIVFFDDFDTGLNGWTKTAGNYEGSLDTMLPPYRKYQAPMLSNITVWDTGTTGSFDGTYALKVATKAERGATSNAMKRLTWRYAGRVRVEYYFTFKPEPSELKLSDRDVRCVGFGFDLQQSDQQGEPMRVMPHIRYLNSMNGERKERWQYKEHVDPIHGISNETRSIYHLGPEGWHDLPAGGQRLCYNETPNKLNWHYVCFDMNLGSMSYLSLRCNDRVFDISKVKPMKFPAWKNLWCMFQPFVWVETDSDKRSFLYIDSAVLSVERM
jgi:hypothetical protein